MTPPPPGTSTLAGAPREGIVTPEAVVLELPAAGLGSRALAFAVDVGIRVGVVLLAAAALAPARFALGETVLVVAGIIGVFALLLVYPVACETIWNGRTPGKMALGLRVVTTEGGPARFRHAAIRAALGMVDFLLGAGALAVLSALVTRRSQRLGDLAAGTIVIRERQARTVQRSVAFGALPGWESYAAAIDVSNLGHQVYVVVRAFLLRMQDLAPAVRAERATSLATRVAARLDLPFPAGTDAEGFLVAVAVAHQARTGGSVAGSPPSSSSVTGWAGASPQPGSAAPAIPPPPVRSKRAVPPAVVTPDDPAPTWGRAGPSDPGR